MTQIPTVTLERLALGTRTERPLLEGQVAYLQQWPSRYVALEPHPTFTRMQLAFTTDRLGELVERMAKYPSLRAYCVTYPARR